MYNKGKIVLVPFPFTDLSSSKVRPALIVSSEKIKGDDLALVFVSSKKTKNLHKVDFRIKKTDKFFAQTGLKGESIIKVNKIATLDKKIILGELGELEDKTLGEIDKRIKILFGL